MIQVYYSSVAHPRCNGQVERANGMILDGLKRRFMEHGGTWTREVPHVIWGMRTQQCRSTGYSPFFLVYGAEAVLPTDLAYGAPRIQHYDENQAEQSRRLDLDSMEEHREAAYIQHARYAQQL